MTKRLSYEAAILPHVPELTRTALRLSGCPSRADDLVQEALFRAWKGWDGFRRGTNARAWMHRILKNTFINHYRRSRRESEVLRQMQDAHATRSQHVWPRVDGWGDEVATALAGLLPEFHEAVMLVDVQRLSYQDAAARMDCPVGTVMSRLHRGRRALREQLAVFARSEGYIRHAA